MSSAVHLWRWPHIQPDSSAFRSPRQWLRPASLTPIHGVIADLWSATSVLRTSPVLQSTSQQISAAGPGLMWQYGGQQSGLSNADESNSRNTNPAKEFSIRIISVWIKSSSADQVYVNVTCLNEDYGKYWLNIPELVEMFVCSSTQCDGSTV